LILPHTGGALSGKGRTIAVLGCGLDVVYPPENEKLFTEISLQGALISGISLRHPTQRPEFPCPEPDHQWDFPGVVVVEASEKSGSLITARIALEQGARGFRRSRKH